MNNVSEKHYVKLRHKAWWTMKISLFREKKWAKYQFA